MQIKQQDTTLLLLEWPDSGMPTLPNDGQGVKQQKLSYIPAGNAKGYSHFGRQFVGEF